MSGRRLLEPLRSDDLLVTFRRFIQWVHVIINTPIYSQYSRPTTADCSADCSANRLVGMVYLVGNWATDCRETAVAGRPPSPGDRRCRATGYCRLISSMSDISLLTRRPATADARRLVGVAVNHLVGIALNDVLQGLIEKLLVAGPIQSGFLSSLDTDYNNIYFLSN